MNTTFQTYQDDTNLPQIFTKKEKNDDLVVDTKNLSELVKQLGNHQDSNTVSLKGIRLEDKFPSKNIIYVSRRNLFQSEISLLSKGLKFAPSVDKID